MPDTLKQLVIVVLILGALTSLYLGAYAPFMKAKMYITALQGMQSYGSLDVFEQAFDSVFSFPSPVGNPEVAKFLSGDVVDLTNSSSQPEDVTRALVAYITPHLATDRIQPLIALGQLYYVLWVRFHTQADFDASAGYLEKALTLGPKFANTLYNLFALYQSNPATQAQAKEVGKTILEYWPSDSRIADFVNGTSSSTASSTATSTTPAP